MLFDNFTLHVQMALIVLAATYPFVSSVVTPVDRVLVYAADTSETCRQVLLLQSKFEYMQVGIDRQMDLEPMFTVCH